MRFADRHTLWACAAAGLVHHIRHAAEGGPRHRPGATSASRVQVGRITGEKGQNARELLRSTGTVFKLPQPPEHGEPPAETAVHSIGCSSRCSRRSGGSARRRRRHRPGTRARRCERRPPGAVRDILRVLIVLRSWPELSRSGGDGAGGWSGLAGHQSAAGVGQSLPSGRRPPAASGPWNVACPERTLRDGCRERASACVCVRDILCVVPGTESESGGHER